MKAMFPDSAITQGMWPKRTKCADNKKKMTEELVKKWRKADFLSYLTSPPTSVCKNVVLKQFQHFSFYLLNVSELESSEDRENPYFIMEKIVLNRPLSIFIGFAADEASNIMGEYSSVSNRLKAVLPGIDLFKRIFHSIHLRASKTARSLPRGRKDWMRSLYSYISSSSKRKRELQEYEAICEVKPHKLLHPCQTRWLALVQPDDHVLELRNPLAFVFFPLQSLLYICIILFFHLVQNQGSSLVY